MADNVPEPPCIDRKQLQDCKTKGYVKVVIHVWSNVQNDLHLTVYGGKDQKGEEDARDELACNSGDILENLVDEAKTIRKLCESIGLECEAWDHVTSLRMRAYEAEVAARTQDGESRSSSRSDSSRSRSPTPSEGSVESNPDNQFSFQL